MAVESDPSTAATAAALSQLQQHWNVTFAADALKSLPAFAAAAEEQEEQNATSSATKAETPQGRHQSPLTLKQLQRMVLFTDLRALPLRPGLPEGKLQLLSNDSYCSSCKVTLGVPLLLMLLSSRDITLPTKEGEEDFIAKAAQSSGRKRLLLLKLTDGKCTYTAIERRYCPQLDNQPLVPGLKLLLSSSTPVLKNLLLLLPDSLQVLGGNVPALANAFRLRMHIQQLRGAGSSSTNAEELLQQQQIGTERTNGPPKFQPFSQAAVRRAVLEGQQVTQIALQQQQLQQHQRGVGRLEDREGKKILLRTFREEAAASTCSNNSGAAAATDSHTSSAGGANVKCSKLEKLQQLKQEKKAAAQLALGADSVVEGRFHYHGSGRGRGGVASGRGGRRMRRNAGREDLEDYQYMKSSNAPVSYNLLDLLQKDYRPTPKVHSAPSRAAESATSPQQMENNSRFAEQFCTSNDGTLECNSSRSGDFHYNSRDTAARLDKSGDARHGNNSQQGKNAGRLRSGVPSHPHMLRQQHSSWSEDVIYAQGLQQGQQQFVPPLELQAQQQLELMMQQQRAALEFYANRNRENISAATAAAARESGFPYQHSRFNNAAAYCGSDVDCSTFEEVRYAQQQMEAVVASNAEGRVERATSMVGQVLRGRGRRGGSGGFQSLGRGVSGQRAEQRGSKREC